MKNVKLKELKKLHMYKCKTNIVQLAKTLQLSTSRAAVKNVVKMRCNLTDEIKEC